VVGVVFQLSGESSESLEGFGVVGTEVLFLAEFINFVVDQGENSVEVFLGGFGLVKELERSGGEAVLVAELCEEFSGSNFLYKTGLVLSMSATFDGAEDARGFHDFSDLRGLIGTEGLFVGG